MAAAARPAGGYSVVEDWGVYSGHCGYCESEDGNCAHGEAR
jgi:hypothetical protein